MHVMNNRIPVHIAILGRGVNTLLINRRFEYAHRIRVEDS